MMLLPLLFLGGLVAIHLVRSSSTPPILPRVSSGGVFQTQREQGRPSLKRLLNILRLGREPEEWVIDDALVEAYDRRDWKTVAQIHRRFYKEVEEVEEEPEEESEEESEETEEETEEETRETEESPSEEIQSEPEPVVIGKVSPFKGVPDEAWDRFVASMATQSDDYQGPKHVGRYHHSKERLTSLKIEDVSTPEKQYEALVTDLTDARDRCQGMITEFEFQPINLESGEQIITLSGILAVIKSAGMEHARSWFTNPDDRKKFPKTTEMFSRANGAF